METHLNQRRKKIEKKKEESWIMIDQNFDFGKKIILFSVWALRSSPNENGYGSRKIKIRNCNAIR
jgi:hypothetical protein